MSLRRAAALSSRPNGIFAWTPSPSMMFSVTVNTGTSMKCWWTMPMPASMASAGPPNLTGFPSIRISPSSGWYRP